MAPHIRSESVVFMLPSKGVPSAVIGIVCSWCRDNAAGLEESSTGEVLRLQNFCRNDCWVFTAPRKLKRQLTAESAECCQTRDGSCRPSKEAPARTATGRPDMPLQTWHALGWLANGVHTMPARYVFWACKWTCVLTSLVSSQTVDEVLVKAGSSCCILPSIVPASSDPASAALTQVITQHYSLSPRNHILILVLIGTTWWI